MTKRKPPGVSWESWVERQIREAQERGDFDNLAGEGKPIEGLDRPHDELWWLKRMLERENLSVLPEALALRRELEDARERIAKLPTVQALRRLVEDLNAKIADVNATATSGPASTLVPLDVERVVKHWRDGRK